MALSNWLTRNEWNIAYFAGLVDKPEAQDLGSILIAGLVVMHKAGWIFEGIDIDDNGNYQKLTQCCDGNEGVLAEMFTGTFNWLERAKETVAYVDFYFPAIDFSKVKDAIRMMEELQNLPK